jgi:hypothetical protein
LVPRGHFPSSLARRPARGSVRGAVARWLALLAAGLLVWGAVSAAAPPPKPRPAFDRKLPFRRLSREQLFGGPGGEARRQRAEAHRQALVQRSRLVRESLGPDQVSRRALARQARPTLRPRRRTPSTC